MAADGQIATQFALRDTPKGATPVASAPLVGFFFKTKPIRERKLGLG